MKLNKKILALVIIVCSLTAGFTSIWIAQAQPTDMSIKEDFEGTTPYTFQLAELDAADKGAEISDWDIKIVAQLTGGSAGKPGDTIEIILYDLTDDKKEGSIVGQGALAVATLVETDLEIDHQYEVRIISKPTGKLITGKTEIAWVETKKSSGIPGFNNESIILGLISGALILWVLKKNS